MISRFLGFKIALSGFLGVVLAGSVSQAEPLPEGALTTELSGKTFKASLKEGYHFNEKAPNSLSLDGASLKPSMIKGRAAEFNELPEKWSSGRASLYVCDDALTFCVPNYVELKGSGPAVAVASPRTTNAKINPTTNPPAINSKVKKSPSAHSSGKSGFSTISYSDALAQLKNSKNKKSLLLIDFAAIWCPGCARLENEIFETRRFKELTRDFVKLKIDVDAFENRMLVDKFDIRGIPALLVVNADQDEIGRVVDFQPLETFEAFFRATREDSTPLKKLNAGIKVKDPKVAYRLGRRLLAAGRYQESVQYLSLVQPSPPELLAAKVLVARGQFENGVEKSSETSSEKNSDAKANFIRTLRDAIQLEPSSSRSIDWRSQLVELLDDKTEIEKVRNEGVKVADVLLADPARLKEAVKTEDVGEFAGYESLLVAMNTGFLVSTSNAAAPPKDADVEAAWKRAVETGRKLNIATEKFGPALRYLIILTKAKMYKEADELAQSLIKKYPENTDVPRRRMTVLLGLKNYPEAIKVGESSLKTSKGRVEFWIAKVLAEAYIGANRKADAKAFISKYLAREEIAWPHMKSEKEALEKLSHEL